MKDEKSDPYAQTVAFYGLGGIFSFIISVLHGGFHYQMSLNQLPFFLLLTVFATIPPILVFKAIKVIESSESSILLSSSRLWIVIGAFIFLQETFSVQKIIGTIVILLGITIAQYRKKRFVINQGVVLLLLAALSYAIADIISFNILRNFDAISFNVYLALFTVIPLMIIKPHAIQKLSFYLKPKYAFNIITVTICDTTASLLLYFAYQTGHNASQIAPIMATQTMLSVILAILILKETNHLANKIIGAVIVVGGLLLVV